MQGESLELSNLRNNSETNLTTSGAASQQRRGCDLNTVTGILLLIIAVLVVVVVGAVVFVMADRDVFRHCASVDVSQLSREELVENCTILSRHGLEKQCMYFVHLQ